MERYGATSIKRESSTDNENAVGGCVDGWFQTGLVGV